MEMQSQPEPATLQTTVDKLKLDIEGLRRAVAELESKPTSPTQQKQESSPDLPPTELAARFCDDQVLRATFLKELKSFRGSPEIIADNRYKNKCGPYWPNDPIKSSWRIREANRYLTEIYRQRELKPVWLSIVVGCVAVAVTLLAIPLSDSIFGALFHPR